MRRVTATAAATVANFGPGFDVLGVCLEGPCDRVSAELTTGGEVEIVGIEGAKEVVGRLSRVAADNCVGVVARAVLDAFAPDAGVRLWLEKGLPLGSGLGSSAASSVAAAVAVAACIDRNIPKELVFSAAREGERLASGSPHADNVAPGLFGGIVACLSGDGEQVDVVTLPVPTDLVLVAVTPEVEVRTADARAVLPQVVPLGDAVRNLGAMAGLVKALAVGDLELLGRCLEDRLATPYRSGLIPGFEAVVRRAEVAGALGSGLSGSGPTVFAVCGERGAARHVADEMVEAFREVGVGSTAIVSGVAREGAWWE